MRLEATTPSTIAQLWTRLEPRVQQSGCLEDAAQVLAEGLHTQFEESIVIARVFLTVPFGALQPENKAFVQRLAELTGAGAELKAGTPVLSLIGTHGQDPEWNDRRKSEGHMGIPLIPSAFVEEIPIMFRLLKEVGVPLDWAGSDSSELIKRPVGRSALAFFVENAAEATDHKGPKIIEGQDFVAAHNVRSVFGTGCGYSGSRALVAVVFNRDPVCPSTAEHFLALIESFERKTTARFATKAFAQ